MGFAKHNALFTGTCNFINDFDIGFESCKTIVIFL